MQKTPGIAILLTGVLATGAFAADTIEQQLQSYYAKGAILVVKKGGIGAAPASAKLGYENFFKVGEIHKAIPSKIAHKADGRDLQVGEKLYLMKLELKNADIAFHVQSCGTCKPGAPDPTHVPYKTLIVFPMLKGWLFSSVELSQVQQMTDQVFTVSTTAPADAPAEPKQPLPPIPPPQAPGAAPMAPIAPPPPITSAAADDPDPAPKPPKIGQTVEQVEANFGKPIKTVKFGAKEIYTYKDLKVTFLDGKVADVE